MQNSLWQDLRKQASSRLQRIVLADGDDQRAIEAAWLLHKEHIVDPILVSKNRDNSLQRLQAIAGRKVTIPCIDLASLPASQREDFLRVLMTQPKFKTLTQAEALQALEDPLILGSIYLKMGLANGFLGGATRTTADTLRAVFSIIGLAPKVSALFGFFLLDNQHASANDNATVLLADCAVIPDPSPKQLAHIALGAAQAYEFLVKHTPKVAFLSFSTAGSAEHPMVTKVREALALAKAKAPRLTLEGEWQADTALDHFTAGVKGVGQSPMAGRANVLIVPDLNCGNIAYKLVQRLGGCRAVGPILWGMAQPANDLSRGCSVDDIIDAAAITAIQAQHSIKQRSEQPSLSSGGHADAE